MVACDDYRHIRIWFASSNVKHETLREWRQEAERESGDLTFAPRRIRAVCKGQWFRWIILFELIIFFNDPHLGYRQCFFPLDRSHPILNYINKAKTRARTSPSDRAITPFLTLYNFMIAQYAHVSIILQEINSTTGNDPDRSVIAAAAVHNLLTRTQAENTFAKVRDLQWSGPTQPPMALQEDHKGPKMAFNRPP